MARPTPTWGRHALAALLLLTAPLHADSVELLSGIRVSGKVGSQTDERIVIRVRMGDGEAEMKFPVSKIHAVTIDGKRRVLNEKGARTKPSTRREPGTEPSTRPTTRPSTRRRRTRTRTEVEALIEKAGSTDPDWWDSVPLEYPRSLDLSWPDRPKGSWNAHKNVGQYLWSVINENPSRWKSGVRFLHHLLKVHQDNPGTLTKVMNSLATAYFNLVSDWPRAAYWYRRSAKKGALRVGGVIRLAECYWKLGSKRMATAQLTRARRYLAISSIKLWSDMGELSKALSLAKTMARYGRQGRPYLVADAYLVAGDACRLHGRFTEALGYYKKALAVPASGQAAKRMEKTRKRAQANIEAVRLYDTLDLKKVDDGTYRASSIAYAGPLEVEVKVQDGRIEAVRVTKYKDKQYYSSLTEIPKQIVDNQSVKRIDAVSSATITSEAIVNATAKALASGMK